MQIPEFPFQTIDWNNIEVETHNGDNGIATWQVKKVGDIRIRLINYSPDYSSDHWCKKGHVMYCVKGEMTTRLEDGRRFLLKTGMIYIVGDNCEAHRSSTKGGCTLFAVD
ncbi:MAG: DHCW motif cupin fold protein [Flavitalea sp.]